MCLIFLPFAVAPIVSSSFELHSLEGSTASLACDSRHWPIPVLTWNYNGTKAYGPSAVLPLVYNVKKTGNYQCVAPLSDSSRVSVSMGLKIHEGSTVSLSCSATGFPLSDLEWRYNGVRIARAVAVSSLTVSLLKLRRGQAGNYECHAQNAVGMANQTTKVEISVNNSK